MIQHRVGRPDGNRLWREILALSALDNASGVGTVERDKSMQDLVIQYVRIDRREKPAPVMVLAISFQIAAEAMRGMQADSSWLYVNDEFRGFPGESGALLLRLPGWERKWSRLLREIGPERMSQFPSFQPYRKG